MSPPRVCLEVDNEDDCKKQHGDDEDGDELVAVHAPCHRRENLSPAADAIVHPKQLHRGREGDKGEEDTQHVTQKSISKARNDPVLPISAQKACRIDHHCNIETCNHTEA